MSEVAAPLIMPRIRPGDFLWTRGQGWVGWITRRFSGAHYAHCGIFVALLWTLHDGAQVWLTVEAWPDRRDPSGDGTRWRFRTVRPMPAGRTHELSIITVARTAAERFAIVEGAAAMADGYVNGERVPGGLRYGWDSIIRIGLHGLGVKWDGKDRPDRAICSEVTAMIVAAAIPGFEEWLPVPANRVWPGALHASVAAFVAHRAQEGPAAALCGPLAA